MGIRTKLLKMAVQRELERHGPEIRAEMDRLKNIRSLDELKVWGREKGGAIGVLVRNHGPVVLDFIKAEWGKLKDRGGRR